MKKILTALLAGALLATTFQAVPAQAGDDKGSHSQRAGGGEVPVYDCNMPNPGDIQPWRSVFYSTVTRGYGTICGDPGSAYNYSVFAWDNFADGGCMAVWVKYLNSSSFSKITSSEACGKGVVRWKTGGLDEAAEVRIVYGKFAAHTVLWRAS